jgi:hypothetical protein
MLRSAQNVKSGCAEAANIVHATAARADSAFVGRSPATGLLRDLRHWPGLLPSLRPGNPSARKSPSFDQADYKLVRHRDRHVKSFAIRRDAN